MEIKQIDWNKFEKGYYDGFNNFGYYDDELISYNMRYTLILNDMNDNITNREIANKYNTTIYYIRQIRKKFDQLKYKPLVKNGRLKCRLCDNQKGLIIHHIHKTREYICILCWGCNLMIGDNELTPIRPWKKPKQPKTKMKRNNNPRFKAVKIEKTHPKTGKKFTQTVYKHSKYWWRH